MDNKETNTQNVKKMNLLAVALSLWMSGFIAFLFRMMSPRYSFGVRDALVIVYIVAALSLYFLSKLLVKRETWGNFTVRFIVIFVIVFLSNGFIRAILDI